ncbi:hypothetical protein [Aureivirga sp. CE67]|uniref:hypothetical protein n=1 Tax=Aureivirga sp. CE67 TaxID=1788983 RepID=UPI0018CACEAC|nr:hypothetical protein [Aureivirga sp. CE67]
MELANIEKLLEKYLNAETTIQEENQLRNYFKNDDIAPHLEEYKPLFSYFEESRNDSFAQDLRLNTSNKKETRWKWMSVAAMLILFVSAYTFINKKKEYEAREAYAQTQEALQLISKNLNKGQQIALNQLGKIEHNQSKIFKNPKQ